MTDQIASATFSKLNTLDAILEIDDDNRTSFAVTLLLLFDSTDSLCYHGGRITVNVHSLHVPYDRRFVVVEDGVTRRIPSPFIESIAQCDFVRLHVLSNLVTVLHTYLTKACEQDPPPQLKDIRFGVEVYPESLRVKGFDGSLPLHVVCRRKELLEVVQSMVEACPESVKSKNMDRMLSLHWAIYMGASFEAVQCLLQVQK
jgi:hypothetical protein